MGQSARFSRSNRFVDIAKDLIPPRDDIRGRSFRVKSMSFGVGDDGNVRLYAMAESMDGESEIEFPVSENIYFDPDWNDPFDVAQTLFPDEPDEDEALERARAILEEVDRPTKPPEPTREDKE